MEFAEAMLAIHLLHHEGRPEAVEESRVEHLSQHIRWQPAFATRVVADAERKGLIAAENGLLRLTDRGRTVAMEAMAR
jgi:manganese/zinc/iron transport system permease protein